MVKAAAAVRNGMRAVVGLATAIKIVSKVRKCRDGRVRYPSHIARLVGRAEVTHLGGPLKP